KVRYMKISKFFQKTTKKINWQDLAIIKVLVFLFALMLISGIDGFANFARNIAWYVYFIVIVILAIPLMRKLYL
ncbi:MAG: hypothetical protein ACLFN8_02685, partial [Candidatus Woesearchaeota archaeon]